MTKSQRDQIHYNQQYSLLHRSPVIRVSHCYPGTPVRLGNHHMICHDIHHEIHSSTMQSL